MNKALQKLHIHALELEQADTDAQILVLLVEIDAVNVIKEMDT